MSIKVLVADDSITIQKVIGIIFGGDEYSLTIVDNGKAAVDKAREINPDILLIDALMPGMSGYEVAEAVRSTPSLATKPILILTGSFEPFDEEKAKKCGADDFIAKPFESQQIITKVKELLELGLSREQFPDNPSLQTSGEESSREPFSEYSLPDIPAPAIDQPLEVQHDATVSDIWGAFTPEEEPFAAPIAAPSITEPGEVATVPDVFALVTEENDMQLVSPVIPAHVSPQHTGSQWIPVEENTFEFEEDEAIVETPVSTVIEPVAPVEIFRTPEPVFTAAVPAAPFAPLADPSPVAIDTPSQSTTVPTAAETPLVLTEEQLKSALASVSKDVIERIVWEIVPDLAEAMIREAIRKIKEGA